LGWSFIVDEKLVTVARFGDSYQANLAKQTLADFGIEAILVGENFANLYFGCPLQPIELQVCEGRSQEAREILEAGEAGEVD
jgi:hypothetical protein